MNSTPEHRGIFLDEQQAIEYGLTRFNNNVHMVKDHIVEFEIHSSEPLNANTIFYVLQPASFRMFGVWTDPMERDAWINFMKEESLKAIPSINKYTTLEHAPNRELIVKELISHGSKNSYRTSQTYDLEYSVRLFANMTLDPDHYDISYLKPTEYPLITATRLYENKNKLRIIIK